MASLNGFNANEVKPAVEFEAIPPGQYTAVITESETKPTKSGTGSYLQLTLQIIDGEFKGRTLWARLNLENPNETTVRIARAELSAVCRAVGVMQPRDSAELHNVPLVIRVGVKARADTGELTNVIKGYERRSGAGGASVAPDRPGLSPSSNGAQAGKAVGAVLGSAPPWKR